MSLWSCTTCFKSFSRKGDLTRHQSLHTGIKPHICETCGKGFAQFSGLKTHRNVHSKAKPYICGIGTCAKAFGDPSSRTRHRKETHRCEGAYKCVIADCGTRIKRRSAFVAHLRKHGLEPNLVDLDAIVLQNEIPTPAHFVSPAVQHKGHSEIEFRSLYPFFPDDSPGHSALSDDEKASYFTGNNGWSDGGLPANDALSLGLMLDQTANVGPSGLPHDIYPYLSGEFNDFFCFGGVFPTTVDYPLVISPWCLPVPGPFLEAGSDGYRSSLASPSSIHSVLHTTDDNVVPLSLASDPSLLYSTM